MSRKTLLAVLAVIGAILTFLKEQFGLAIDTTTVLAGVTAILLYVLFEMKLDWKRMASQIHRFKDPKFWLAFISALLVAIQNAFGLNLPVEAIVVVLTVIMSILFGADFAKLKKET